MEQLQKQIIDLTEQLEQLSLSEYQDISKELDTLHKVIDNFQLDSI
jgi:hypothetical protein